ncbi:MAG: transposase [Nitrososphaerota archaeon]|jgi:hypothetical protein|nr:transposase [Nitrososphaerota archaeon]
MDIDSSTPREEECISTLREARWPDGGIACPRCGSDRVARTVAFYGLERRNEAELLDGSPPVVEPFPRRSSMQTPNTTCR